MAWPGQTLKHFDDYDQDAMSNFRVDGLPVVYTSESNSQLDESFHCQICSGQTTYCNKICFDCLELLSEVIIIGEYREACLNES